MERADSVTAAAVGVIRRLEHQLRDARALIRWCYHDDEKMPPNWREIIEDAKDTV